MKTCLIIPTLLFTFLNLALSQGSTAQFQIRKRHTSGDKTAIVGKLTLNIHSAYNTVEASVNGHIDEFISVQDFKDGHQAILEFVCIETDIPDYKDKVYMTSVDQITSEPHGQKIAIILGPSSQGISINAINYVQTRERPGQLFAEVISTVQKDEQIFKYQYAPKKTQAQNQSFWSRYKWPLIIGGVVLYTMLTANPDKGGAPAQGK